MIVWQPSMSHSTERQSASHGVAVTLGWCFGGEVAFAIRKLQAVVQIWNYAMQKRRTRTRRARSSVPARARPNDGWMDERLFDAAAEEEVVSAVWHKRLLAHVAGDGAAGSRSGAALRV